MNKPTGQKAKQPLSKFNEPSYGSPQSAIMGKMGQPLPRMEPLPMGPWPFEAGAYGKPKKKKKR